MTKKILAISSAGGHWVQLQRLRSAWNGCQVTYVTTKDEYEQQIREDAKARDVAVPTFFAIVAANRWQKFRLIWQLLTLIYIIVRVRPDVVVSTGAASGYFALRLGKMMGARTIWVDSIANAEELSLSGQKIGKYADLWLTQWADLAGDEAGNGPTYQGAVI
jgi:exopolysaccharide biosynthesis glucuronosyltransferase PssD